MHEIKIEFGSVIVGPRFSEVTSELGWHHFLVSNLSYHL